MSTLPAYKLHATVTGVVIIFALLLLFFRYMARFDRRVLFFAGWALLFMVPGMLYYPVFYYFTYEHVDHRAYTSCFGLLLIVLVIVQTFDLDRKRYFNAVCLLLLVWLAACNLYFSESYRNPAAFARRAIDTNPNSAHAYAIYGTELHRQGRDDEALENVNRSLRIFSKFTQALHVRAVIYRKRWLYREALADLDTLLGFNPEAGSDDYILRAEVKVELQDYAGAMRDYGLALKLDPGNETAANGLQELQRTVRDNRLLPNVRLAQQYNLEGVKAGERNEFKVAETLFRRALASDPGFHGVNVNLGNVLYAQGRRDEACAAWRVAAEHGNATAAELFNGYCGR